MKVLVTDIDGTLAIDGWRSTISDYDERQKAAGADLAVQAMVQMVNGLVKAKWHVIGLTSRNERWRQLTNKWLAYNDSLIGDLQMRADDDFTPTVEYKVQAIKALGIAKTTLLLIDSREDVVQAYKMEGWVALCTHS